MAIPNICSSKGLFTSRQLYDLFHKQNDKIGFLNVQASAQQTTTFLGVYTTITFST